MSLADRLRRDTYAIDPVHTEVEAAYRQGWNDAIRHAATLATQGDVEAGLRELRDAEPRVMAGVVEFDLTDIGGEG